MIQKKVFTQPGINLLNDNKETADNIFLFPKSKKTFVVELKSPGKSYVLSCDISPTGSDIECSIKWRVNNEIIRTDFKIINASDNKIFWLIYAPAASDNAIIDLTVIGNSNIKLINLKFSHELVSGFGEVMEVTDIEDINEPMEPDEFWSLFPVLDLPHRDRKIHLNPLLRQYFDVGFIYELDFGFDVTEKTDKFMNLPIRFGMLGQNISEPEPYIIAGDIKHNPIMRSHFHYSKRYYPRRQNDYLGLYFLPSYVLSQNQKYLTRAEELFDFFKYSRWEKDGTNSFVKDCYPKDYTLHPEWFAGFDYLFDWQWLDGYGYFWKYHEPDHHVNSAIASCFVTAFQLTGKEEYFKYAFDFVYNQFPRYGFHKGIYKGHVYYYTEYNPTGLSLGNPINDSTDNVVSLAASACATIGYYVKDPVLKGRLFELTRGFLWYLVREYDYDKWFYYDGAENPLNPRRYVSHDMAAMRFAFSALSYLYKAGADIEELLCKFNEIDNNITKNSEVFKKIGHFRLYKIYEGTLKKGNPVRIINFIKIKTNDTHKAYFSDDIPEGFIASGNFYIRISKLDPPDNNKKDFTIREDIVYTISKEQLATGVLIPFELLRGDELRISYELTCNKDFIDVEKNTDSKISAVINNGTNNYSVEATTSNSVIGDITYSMPFNIKSIINGANFVSFAAMLNYPLSDEINVSLIDKPAPEAVPYNG